MLNASHTDCKIGFPNLISFNKDFWLAGALTLVREWFMCCSHYRLLKKNMGKKKRDQRTSSIHFDINFYVVINVTWHDIASVPINMCNGFPVEFLPIIQASRVQFIESSWPVVELWRWCNRKLLKNLFQFTWIKTNEIGNCNWWEQCARGFWLIPWFLLVQSSGPSATVYNSSYHPCFNCKWHCVDVQLYKHSSGSRVQAVKWWNKRS